MIIGPPPSFHFLGVSKSVGLYAGYPLLTVSIIIGEVASSNALPVTIAPLPSHSLNPFSVACQPRFMGAGVSFPISFYPLLCLGEKSLFVSKVVGLGRHNRIIENGKRFVD